MPETSRLLSVARIREPIEAFLRSEGEVFRAIEGHDSDCVSHGVEFAGRRFFVKHSTRPRGLASLARAERLHAKARHDAIPRLRHAFAVPGGRALVYDWVDGEVLYDGGGAGEREDPKSAHARFRALPLPRILAALDAVYDAHLEIAAKGFVAVDLYDGCVIHDFERGATWLCDLDEYREGPFVLDADRLPGSTRFLSPEERRRGAVIDEATTVHALGRLAAVFLSDGDETSPAWRGSGAQRAVLTRATRPAREARHPTVEAFVSAWRAAGA